MYSPALTRGWHGRAARCIWALVSQRGTHDALPQGGLRLVFSLGDCMFLQGDQVQALYVLRSRPSSELSCRWYARSWCRDQGHGVRAGESVGALETRCLGPPPSTCK